MPKVYIFTLLYSTKVREMTAPRELYGKGGLYKGMYTTLDTVKGMGERKRVYYSPLELVIRGQEATYKPLYHHNPLYCHKSSIES